MKPEKKYYVNAKELSEILDCSVATAYRIIHEANKSLKSEGYYTLQGKAPRSYVAEKFHGFSQ